MLFAILFFIELFLLFFLSKQVTKRLSLWLYHLTRSRTKTIFILAFLFLPGTFLHELAHAFMAMILFVPVGKMELIPKIQEDGYVKLGSVAIGRTDFFRRFLIGIAPLLIGTTILLFLLFYAATHDLFTHYTYLLIVLYCVFEIGNTMFSSKKDMEGALELLLTCCFAAVVAFILGARIPLNSLQQFFERDSIIQMFYYGNLFLLIPIVINIICIGVLHVITSYKKNSHPHG